MDQGVWRCLSADNKQLDPHFFCGVPQCYYPEIPLPGLRAPQVAGTAGLFQMTALARADSPNAAVALFLRLCRAQVKQARLTAGAAVE